MNNKYLKLLRVNHWGKNILIFLPLFFSGNVFNIKFLKLIFVTFLMFCFLSSLIYINNDICDVESDKKHPQKKNRPLPKGEITIKTARLIQGFLLLLVFGMILLLYLTVNEILIIFLPSLYLIINILYSKWLKKIAIIDVVILVAGFLIRVFLGSITINVELSNWLYLMIMFGSFYLGLGKRRNEIIKNGNLSREVLSSYNKSFLDKNMYSCLTLSIISYSLWATDSVTVSRIGNNYVIWTIPIVMIIFMLYSLNIESDSFGDPVDVVLNDKRIISMIGVYGIIIFLILYVL